MFAPEGWIIADSIPPYQPSQLMIDAIEDSIIIEVPKEENKKHDVSKLLKRMAVLQERIIMLMSATAIERYRKFISTYPDIVQRVPQKMIASYLGITPEALSSLKKQL